MRYILAISAAILLASSVSAASAQTVAEAERITCEHLVKEWTPVKLPATGFNVAIPCSDSELSAFKNANEERKHAEGIVACERAGRTYTVLYAVNTPAGFFDRFTAEWTTSPVQNFQVAGHRVFRAAAVKDGTLSGTQLIEIDPRRSIAMVSSSKVPNDADFSDLASCFFNTLLPANP